MQQARALVADDDPLMLELVASVVERLGIDVIYAASGGELLEAIAEHGPFDIIITDIQMPWMSGLQVMHSARAAGLPCPVVIMTGLRDPKIYASIRSLGALAVLLPKPFSLVELYAAVELVTSPGEVDVLHALHP